MSLRANMRFSEAQNQLFMNKNNVLQQVIFLARTVLAAWSYEHRVLGRTVIGYLLVLP